MKTTFNFLGVNRMKLTRRAAAVLLGLMVASCPSCKKAPETVAKGKVIIKGSNTLGEELLPRLITEYKKDHPEAVIELESKGTGTGFKALLAGECDIAGASRTANNDELEQAHTKGVDLNTYMVGSYSVAVVVNATNPVANLTREQIRDVFTGVVQNWKDVGGPDAAVHLYIRDPISGTYLGFRELAMEDKPYAANPKSFTNYAGIAQAVAQDPNGIGYSSIDLTKTPGVKAISIGAVAPSTLTVAEGRYAYTRALRVYTNKASEAVAARDFIEFIQSPRGQKIVTEMGFIQRP